MATGKCEKCGVPISVSASATQEICEKCFKEQEVKVVEAAKSEAATKKPQVA